MPYPMSTKPHERACDARKPCVHFVAAESNGSVLDRSKTAPTSMKGASSNSTEVATAWKVATLRRYSTERKTNRDRSNARCEAAQRLRAADDVSAPRSRERQTARVRGRQIAQCMCIGHRLCLNGTNARHRIPLAVQRGVERPIAAATRRKHQFGAFGRNDDVVRVSKTIDTRFSNYGCDPLGSC